MKYRPGILQERLRIVRKTLTTAAGKGLDKTASDARQKLDAVVATWANQPGFEITARDTAQVLKREVSIYGNLKAVRVFGYVDRGTKPHVIRPKKARFLRFQGGYNPKTRFRAKFGGPGKSNGKFFFRGIVHHPGNKGREFGATYREQAAVELRANIIRELKK